MKASLRSIIELMRNGGTLGHSYVGASHAILQLNGYWRGVRMATVREAIEQGLIEEIEDDHPDVRYKLTKKGATFPLNLTVLDKKLLSSLRKQPMPGTIMRHDSGRAYDSLRFNRVSKLKSLGLVENVDKDVEDSLSKPYRYCDFVKLTELGIEVAAEVCSD